jgi:hypothetical protein
VLVREVAGEEREGLTHAPRRSPREVTDFLALAHEDDELVRAEAEQLLEDLAPGVVTLLGGCPRACGRRPRSSSPTRGTVGALVATAILRRVPSGASRMSEVGKAVIYFAQPRASMDVLLNALGLPIPETWGARRGQGGGPAEGEGPGRCRGAAAHGPRGRSRGTRRGSRGMTAVARGVR